jgi:hypothetical protein
MINMGKGFALMHGGNLGDAVVSLERASEIAIESGHAGQISFVEGVLDNARTRLEQQAREGREDGTLGSALAGTRRVVEDPGAVAEAATRMAYVKSLVARSPVLLVMKGTPELPQCGFSLQAVRILWEIRLHFDSYDISADNM